MLERYEPDVRTVLRRESALVGLGDKRTATSTR